MRKSKKKSYKVMMKIARQRCEDPPYCDRCAVAAVPVAVDRLAGE